MKDLIKSLIQSWWYAALIAVVGVVAAVVLVAIREEPPTPQYLPQEVWKDDPAMYTPATPEAQASDSL